MNIVTVGWECFHRVDSLSKRGKIGNSYATTSPICPGVPTEPLGHLWSYTVGWPTSRCGTESCQILNWKRWRQSQNDNLQSDLQQITGCRLFKEGNLVNWIEETWHLNSSLGTVSHFCSIVPHQLHTICTYIAAGQEGRARLGRKCLCQIFNQSPDPSTQNKCNGALFSFFLYHHLSFRWSLQHYIFAPNSQER